MLPLLRVEVRGVQGAVTSGCHHFSTASHRRTPKVIRSDFAACAHMPEPGASRGIYARWAACGVADSVGLVFLNGSARRRCGRQDARPQGPHGGEDGFRLPPRQSAVRRRPPSAAPPAQPHLGISSALLPRGGRETQKDRWWRLRGASAPHRLAGAVLRPGRLETPSQGALPDGESARPPDAQADRLSVRGEGDAQPSGASRSVIGIGLGALPSPRQTRLTIRFMRFSALLSAGQSHAHGQRLSLAQVQGPALTQASVRS